VIGVGELAQISSKKGEFKKRDITILDDTAVINLSLWNDQAAGWNIMGMLRQSSKK
jgi:hypothetical protein